MQMTDEQFSSRNKTGLQKKKKDNGPKHTSHKLRYVV